MDIEFNTSSSEATFQDFEAALAACDWNFHESEDEAAVASYKLCREIEGKLVLKYCPKDPTERNLQMLQKINIIWNQYAPEAFQVPEGKL